MVCYTILYYSILQLTVWFGRAWDQRPNEVKWGTYIYIYIYIYSFYLFIHHYYYSIL